VQTAYIETKGVVVRHPAAKRVQSDRDLLTSIAAGDRSAMRAFYDRYNVQVYLFVLRLIRDASNAEDVVSEVFFVVWRQAGRFEYRSEVSTWVLAIARYKAISVMRQRQDEPLEDAAAHEIVDEANDSQVALEKKDTAAVLRGCLTRLSAKHREVIDLVYYHKKSVNEVAEIIGVPTNTVKTRLFYARQQMRKLYEQTAMATRSAA
jgi:RNA polymerase sigma-70 factor (ECF subfamily)